MREFNLSLTLGAHAQRGLQYTWSVSPSVRLSVTTFSATTRNKAAKKLYQRVQCHTGLIFKIAIFVKVLRSSYGVKTKRTSQYANKHGLPRSDSEHGGGSRSNTKGEYVVLVFQKHYLPT